MLAMDYYLYLYKLEETQRNKEILLICALIAILFFIAIEIEMFKYTYLDKIKNEHIRNFIMKL